MTAVVASGALCGQFGPMQISNSDDRTSIARDTHRVAAVTGVAVASHSESVNARDARSIGMCGLWRRLQTRPTRSACEGFVVRVGPGGRPNPRIPSFRQSFRSAYGSHGSIYVQCRRDRGRRRRIRACRLRIASCSIIMLSYRRTHLLRDRAGMDWMTETAMKCNVWGAGGCGAWFCRRWGCDLFSVPRPMGPIGPEIRPRYETI